ncbi:MAG: amidohydrolase/deacetylase family metallohydrolase [Alphaproteobacteria bacterium]|nr:amidohydrolase/deacetylase family metallohydrolase [Alphaproteobacteria bacterium]
MSFDLVLRGGRVIDPGQGIDRVGDVAFTGGKVAAIGPDLSAQGKTVKDCAGKLVTPGLIDLHTHVYWGGTSLGIDAAEVGRAGGVTTFIDAGSAGPGNFHGFRRHVIEPSPLRILAYLNISFPGIYAFSERVMVGENADLRLLDPVECLRVAKEHRDLIVGIKVRVGRGAGGESGIAPLDMAIEVAEELDLPVMAHLDHPPPSRRDVLDRLRKGDVLTHCFRPFPNAPAVLSTGRVRDEVLAARARGVIFDIGHGAGSFGFGTAKAMLASGFKPDVISSDLHTLAIKGPAFDLPTTLSKFLCLGLEISEVIAAATVRPAAAIRRPELGTLKTGGPGDATILDLAKGNFQYKDVLGETYDGATRLLPMGMVVGGRWWHP